MKRAFFIISFQETFSPFSHRLQIHLTSTSFIYQSRGLRPTLSNLFLSAPWSFSAKGICPYFLHSLMRLLSTSNFLQAELLLLPSCKLLLPIYNLSYSSKFFCLLWHGNVRFNFSRHIYVSLLSPKVAMWYLKVFIL